MQKSTLFPEIKKGCIFCFILLLAGLNLWAQNAVGFEDARVQVLPGDMGWLVEESPPRRWEVDSLNPISGLYSLHHSFDNPEPGCDYYILHHHPFRGDSLTFSFGVMHTYPPSAANNWQLALLADYEGELREGIIVGVNLTVKDDMVRLWRIREGELEELGVSELNYQEKVGTGSVSFFRLTWQRDGMLALAYAEDSQSGMREICSCSAGDLPEGRSLVIRYEYSAAQDRKLWIDDLLLDGEFPVDTIPPLITEVFFESSKVLIIKFNEGIYLCDTSSVLLSHWIVPDSLLLEGHSLRMYLPDAPPNRETLDLTVGGICDRDGNRMKDSLLGTMLNESQWGDIVINEVMADPDPPLKESLGEYVELYNRSGYHLNLEGWKLKQGERSYPLTEVEKGSLLAPGDYLVFYDISLPNPGGTLSLYNGEGSLIHAAEYSLPYGGPPWKVDGGWSLESPDPEQWCNTSLLWEYSDDRSGGTPGTKNSISGERPDNQPPLFLYYGYRGEGHLELHYSERVYLAQQQEDEIRLNPGNYRAVEVLPAHPLGKSLYCRFALNPGLLARYSFQMPALSDCKENLSRELFFYGGRPLAPEKGSVLINEIMYDPLEGFAEYIELYNPGQHFADLAELGIDVGGLDDQQKGLKPLSRHSRIMGPGQYLVLTGSIPHLMDSYRLELSGAWVELENFPSLPNGEGRIWLSDLNGQGIDAASYGDEYHMELISDTRGISLERIASGKTGDDPSNWHSAASIEGYATPGRVNSQTINDLDAETGLSVYPGVFSPDNDGYHDLLVIVPGKMDPGCVIRLWISRTDGSLVRMLANNHVSSTSSQYTWDGRKDGGQMVEGGFYVVHFAGYNPVSGARWRQKKAVGLHY